MVGDFGPWLVLISVRMVIIGIVIAYGGAIFTFPGGFDDEG